MNNSIYKKGLAVVLIIVIIIMAVLGIKLSGKEKKFFLQTIQIQMKKMKNQKRQKDIFLLTLTEPWLVPGFIS